MMKFKIVMMDGTVIYANDICMTGPLHRLGIWTDELEIDSMDLSDIRYIWVLDPDRDILILI